MYTTENISWKTTTSREMDPASSSRALYEYQAQHTQTQTQTQALTQHTGHTCNQNITHD